MPTTAERHALLFLAALAVTGAGVRFQQSRTLDRVVADAFPEAPLRPLADRAVAAQLAAVDSARATTRRRGKNTKAPRTAPDTARAARTPTRPQGPVPVNRATAQELERLPGIGPALAQRLVAYRERHGPFRSLDDLLGVPGIGKATAAKLAPSVTF
ncbi:MAG: ComEA family DNA-binding protein [Gemmatimonadaceae bacterium]